MTPKYETVLWLYRWARRCEKRYNNLKHVARERGDAREVRYLREEWFYLGYSLGMAWMLNVEDT